LRLLPLLALVFLPAHSNLRRLRLSLTEG
jgi:hypothetical protein